MFDNNVPLWEPVKLKYLLVYPSPSFLYHLSQNDEEKKSTLRSFLEESPCMLKEDKNSLLEHGLGVA